MRMSGARRSELVQNQERDSFLQEFQKDLGFLQLVLLLLNKSSAVKSVDLVWLDQPSARRVGLRLCTGTVQAMHTPMAALLECDDPAPHPAFCRIVNDCGRHEAESCGVSDTAAAEMALRTGQTQIYRCHAGLVDIAVPVQSDGRYLAMLYAGQVLTESPTEQSFAKVSQSIARLGYIDPGKLKESYWEVPVVSPEEIQKAARVLEEFARFLGMSWSRLRHALAEQRAAVRELQLLRKELAYCILEGDLADRARITRLMRSVGFRHPPNRLLLVRLEEEGRAAESAPKVDVSFTAASHAVEELTDEMSNVCVAHLRNHCLCVFLHESRGTRALNAYGLAGRILEAVCRRVSARPKIGIGGIKQDLGELIESYEEAAIALAGSDTISVFRGSAKPESELPEEIEILRDCILKHRFSEAKLELAGIPQLVRARVGSGDLHSLRRGLESVLERLAGFLEDLGIDGQIVAQIRSESRSRLSRAGSAIALEEAFRRCADSVVEGSRLAFASRHEKLVEQARRSIRRSLEDNPGPVSVDHIAAQLGVSGGHLSRVFKQVTGHTCEQHVIEERIELARRLLLDPMRNIAQVAEQCGFSSPAYFARLFRRFLGCSPREYASNPLRFSGQEPASGAAG